MSGVFAADFNAQMLETDANMSASFQRCICKHLHNAITDLKHNLCLRVLSVYFAFSINEP